MKKIQIRLNSLVVRAALGAGVVTFVAAVVCVTIFSRRHKAMLENSALENTLVEIERIANSTLGYLYQQENNAQLVKQQQYLNSTPNIIYSYIVSERKTIAMGMNGFDGHDIGQKKQEWEPEVDFEVGKTKVTYFHASPEMNSVLANPIKPQEKIYLISIPIRCPEFAGNCALLRVGIRLANVEEVILQFDRLAFLFSIILGCVAFFIVWIFVRREITPFKNVSEYILDVIHDPEKLESVKVLEKRRFQNEEEKILLQTLEQFSLVHKNSVRDSAIAKTMQMLAHDVRRPFSLLRSLLELLRINPQKIQDAQWLKESSIEIENSLSQVEDLIRDILEAGTRGTLFKEEKSLEFLLKNAISQVQKLFPECEVKLDHHFEHSTSVLGDENKLTRVFQNVIVNAVEAMRGVGRIWIHSRSFYDNQNQAWIEVVVGNSGSIIDKSDLPKLFDTFYTKGKKSGTGLGLAIVHKIVAAHGGKVWCESDADRGVEFFFTLPAVEPKLRQSVTEFPEKIEGKKKTRGRNSQEVISTVQNRWTGSGCEMNLLILDDDQLYGNVILELISHLSRFENEQLCGYLVTNEQEAVNELKKRKFDVMICDYDLGSMSKTGLDIITEQNKVYPDILFCLHSNHVDVLKSELDLKHVELAFPKPMTQEILHKILHAASLKMKPLIHLIEDDLIFRTLWAQNLRNDVHLVCHPKPEDFKTWMDENHHLVPSIRCIILDHFYQNHSQWDGLSFASYLKDKVTCPLILATNAAQEMEQDVDKWKNVGIHRVISKSALSWPEFKILL